MPRVILATDAVRAGDALVIDHGHMCIWYRGRRHLDVANTREHLLFKIAAALIVRCPGYVSTRELVAHLYGDRSDGGPVTANAIVRSIIHYGRARLAAFGLVLITARHLGYCARWCAS